MIYLASPYTHHDRKVEIKRYEQVLDIVLKMLKEGKNVFSPIVYCHPFTYSGEAGDIDTWIRFDLHMLKLADKLVILELDGWEESKGIQEEIKFAEQNGILVDRIKYYQGRKGEQDES